MSFVIPIVGTLAVHIAFSIGGSVPLPVAASCVVAAPPFICVGSSEARVTAMVGSLTVAVPSEIISCAPACCGVAALSTVVPRCLAGVDGVSSPSMMYTCRCVGVFCALVSSDYRTSICCLPLLAE